MATNKQTISELKDKLREGGLTERRRNRIAQRIRNLGGKVALKNFPAAGETTGGGGATTPAKSNTPKIDKATDKATAVVESGTEIGKQILPEAFTPGTFDRTTFNPVTAERVNAPTIDFERMNFDKINQFLDPSVREAVGLRDDTAGRYDELVGLRRDKLGGLNAAENQALKESLFRDIDRQKRGALREVHRTPGLGAGASFAQRRAVGRNFGDQAIGANRQLLLDNVGIKRQALGDFEGTVGSRQAALGGMADRIGALRGIQAQARQGVDQFNSQGQSAIDQFNAANQIGVGQFNANNALNAGQFNSTGQFASDQFNAGQQRAELGARVGAIGAGAGMVGDERDRMDARKRLQQMLKFLEERDAAMAAEAQSLFG